MTEEEQITLSKIAERLSFFFSNANLRTDKFMRREIMDEKQNKGFISIDVLLRFNTIKSITDDQKLIAKAVKDVKKPALKLNDDESAIGRVEAFTQAMMDDNVSATLRVSNIPTKETDKGLDYDVTRDEMATLFQEYGDVAMVRLLKSKLKGHDNKVAVGRAFVEFHSAEDMKKAVDELCIENIEDESLKPKKVLKVQENDLRVKTMQQWLDKKEKQREQRGGGGGGRNNTKAEKRKAEQEQDKAEIEAIEFKLDWKPGCVISVKGLPENCDREAIISAAKGFLGDEITVRADYSRGLKDGAIRFDAPNDKISALATELQDGKVTVGGEKIDSATVLEGDDEKKYYDEYIAFRTKQMRINAEEKLKRKRRKSNRQ